MTALPPSETSVSSAPLKTTELDDPRAHPARAYGRLLSSGESGSAGALPLFGAGLRARARRWPASSAPTRPGRGEDLLGIDALEVDGGRAEVGVPELALMMFSGTPSGASSSACA